MLNFEVTIGALDLMVRYVDFMKFVGLFESFETIFLVMAGDASFSGHTTLIGTGRGVAGLALHTESGYLSVVEVESPRSDDLVGNLVTERAGGRALPRLLALEMTDQAARGRDLHVAALDDLGMAGSASQLLAAS